MHSSATLHRRHSRHDRNLSQLKFSRVKLGNVRRHCWAGTSLTDPDGSFNPEATTCTVGNGMGEHPRSSWHGTAFVLRTGWMSARTLPLLVPFLTLLRRHDLGKPFSQSALWARPISLNSFSSPARVLHQGMLLCWPSFLCIHSALNNQACCFHLLIVLLP